MRRFTIQASEGYVPPWPSPSNTIGHCFSPLLTGLIGAAVARRFEKGRGRAEGVSR